MLSEDSVVNVATSDTATAGHISSDISVAGYLIITRDGVSFKIPYYNN